MEWYYKGTLEPATSLIWLCPIGYGKFECRIYGSNGWQPLTTEGASADYREVRALLDNKVGIEPDKYMISAELLDKLAGLKTEAELDEIINAAALAFSTHAGNTNNPHKVSKSQLGLGNVDNTSDAQKPVSQATQTALDQKVDCTIQINDHSLTGDVTLTKGDVGLSHVDDTSDINKPISVVQQAALDAKLDKALLMPIATQSEAESNTENTQYMTSLRTFQQWTRNISYSLNNSLNTISKTILGAINELFANKVDKTTKINNHPLSGDITIIKSDIGIGNVDNTSDINKPVSISQQAALNAKLDKTSVKQTTGTSTTDVMSQKAVTDELALKADQIELDQLAGEMSLLDTIQGAKIKDIESVISTLNPNQSAQLSASGASPLSLPKNAANGGMSVKMEGLTAENIVVNGDFRNGMAGWSVYDSAGINLEGDYLVFKSNTIVMAFSQPNKSFNIGDKMYMRAVIKVETTPVGCNIGFAKSGIGTNLLPTVTIGTSDTLISGVLTTTNNVINDFIIGRNVVIGEKAYLKKGAITINLTTTFGAGNEPTKEQCDLMFADYFEGVKSFEPTGRVRSVGKNLLNQRHIKIKEYVSIDDGLIKSTDASDWLATDYIKVQPNTTYRTNVRGDFPSAGIAYYDVNKIYIAGLSTTPLSVNKTFTTPNNAEYLRASHTTRSGVKQTDLWITRGVADITYEPYRETSLYLTAPEFRSNGTVKDEMRKWSNGYELVKRVGVGTLGIEKVINGTFDSTSNWDVPSGGASISGGTLNIDVTAWGTDIKQSMSFVKDKYYFVEFDITVLTRAGNLFVYSNDGASINVGAVGHYYMKFKASTTGPGSLRINSSTIACSIDNISVKEVTESEEIASTSTFTKIGSNVHYTLATPVITPISYGGILNSAGNGTVYHEPIIADAGVYSDKMEILLTDYPIATIEEIIKHENGVDTYLNIATAVIASDGLSFTHPDLVSGDLVLFTYAFDKESTHGNITASFYNSNVVKIDTVTGKAYRINEVVTNGVLTRTLTEV